MDKLGFSHTDCDDEELQVFNSLIKATKISINEFRLDFCAFQKEQYKTATELQSIVTAYNTLNSGPPCSYPLVAKEEMLQELIVQIQEKTALVHHSILLITKKLEKAQKNQKKVRKHAQTLDWNQITNGSIRGNIKHPPPSEFLEQSEDLVFQYGISINCVQQYFNALSLQQPKSYEHLSNSFKISFETDEIQNKFHML